MRLSLSSPAVNGLGTLTLIFVAWKALLFFLIAFCPGPGYDTSAQILLDVSRNQHGSSALSSVFDRLAMGHLRWDAFYFVSAAKRGYVYEQEWAFSRSYSALLAVAGHNLLGYDGQSLTPFVWAGILISNACHLLSVFVLFRLAREVMDTAGNINTAFAASVLHIISPAGVFLSAPYAESLFSLLNFTGILLYVRAKHHETGGTSSNLYRDANMLGAGFLFGCATLIRSNGLLSGLILLYDVACLLPRIMSLQLSSVDIRRAIITCISGAVLSLGFVAPQFIAYQEYCIVTGDKSVSRPWCDEVVPSIYSWVQSKYWNVGFLRYWSIPNIPLFMLAMPMLLLLSATSMAVLREGLMGPVSGDQPPISKSVRSKTWNAGIRHLPELALPQLFLVVAATTSFHVQVINRLSSGYPLWYLVLAEWITDASPRRNDPKATAKSQFTVRWMVMYSIFQGLLFVDFLPPA
ncbi:glycosyltransferase family 76 protein [Sporormia fimetaria CBS 119925]|uniref:GPI mannosyltransferase 2 n=1 Tax=Sporormia fimetaria CBS 119925 TaxID=1340428 RepID=A0A6A6VG15_9PLEO|nr:glycosyltransferase family 76 protein [Sporormia fimetaria CBS 119925]